VQIFDVVVSIQMKFLKADEEKGLAVKAFCRQLVGPNREGKSLRSVFTLSEKGNPVHIPEPVERFGSGAQAKDPRR
jgi:hypothetical protein